MLVRRPLRVERDSPLLRSVNFPFEFSVPIVSGCPADFLLLDRCIDLC